MVNISRPSNGFLTIDLQRHTIAFLHDHQVFHPTLSFLISNSGWKKFFFKHFINFIDVALQLHNQVTQFHESLKNKPLQYLQ